MRFKIWLMVEWSPSQDFRDECIRGKAWSNERMCFKDLIHENTFAIGWAISIMSSHFQLSSLHFSSLLESFSMFCCWAFLYVTLLSLSLCCVVKSSFVMLSHVPLNYHINVVSFLIKIGLPNLSCIMWSLFTSFEMNKSLNLTHWLIQTIN